jgi:hypothetical protein
MKIVINVELLKSELKKNNKIINKTDEEFLNFLCDLCNGEIVNDSLDDFINYAKEIGFSIEYFNGGNSEISYYKLIRK